MKEFSCGAVIPGCEAKFSADTENEILGQVAAHARADHGLDEVPDEVVAEVRSHIVEVPAS